MTGAAYSRHPCRQSADADIVSRFPPAFQHFSRKYQHPPTNIFDMAPHTPGVLRFGKFKKTVAPAGYKNKQCRKQTSVLSGRTVTAYVPLRSATGAHRTKVRACRVSYTCQGLRGYFAKSQFCNLYHQSRKYVYGVQIL